MKDHPIDLVARAKGMKLYELAKELGITKSALGQYRTNGIPIDKCVKLERLSGGAVTRKQMRPNDYADYWPDLAA